jgi:hypothetical protein
MPAGTAETSDRQLRAAGTVSRRPVSVAWRVWLALELLLLFVAAPIGMEMLIHQQRIPLFVALLPVLGVVVLMLVLDQTFQLRRELSRWFGWRTALTILLIFVVGGAAVTYWVKVTHPGWFMDMPTNRPETWKRVMLLYPIGSVLAQEIIYRTFYFHRYGPLFGRFALFGLLLNGPLFGLAHIVVGTPFALVSTCFTGLLFAVRYHTARSFWAVWIEHALWGWLVFTVGLNHYFFTGIPNP